jgi:fatty-acyl-CoA synthase
MILAGWIARHAAFSPRKVAIRFRDADLTYAQFAVRIDRMAAKLAALGVGRGDAVAWLGLNHPDVLALMFACARLGSVLVPLNWRLAPPEHARMLSICRPRVLFFEEPFAPQVNQIGVACPVHRHADDLWNGDATLPAVAGNADSPVLLCFTSGSTGVPKGVPITQRAIFWNAINSTHMHDMTSADRILTTLPLFHVGGFNVQTTPALHCGATVVLHPRFEPQAALDAIERECITLTVLVPSQLAPMMELPRWQTADFSSLRMITTGSTIISEALVRKINARGVPLIPVYGSTETCPVASYVRAEDAERKAGSAGVPALHCDIRIADDNGCTLPAGSDGEILVRGPNVATEYWNAPEQSAQAFVNGWYHSGDIGHFDDEGHLYVVSRKKDMIISGGENIYPAELEEILVECPAVQEACVVGRPDARWGETVVAAIVLRPGSKLSRAEVMALFQGRIARYKHPRDVLFLPDLPRSGLGKVLKDEVRRTVAQAAAAGAEGPGRGL